jgi:predicted metal-dependent peptidase
MQTIADLITRMRVATHAFRPYMARLIYAMPMHEVAGHPDLQTLGVDRHGRCYYNPEYLRSVPVEQGAYLLLHEALHVVLRHAAVMQQLIGASPSPSVRDNANIAVDLVVEQLLRGSIQRHLPDGGVRYEQYGFPPSLSAPEYFRLLEQQASQSQPQPQQESSNGSNDADSLSSSGRDVEDGSPGDSPNADGGHGTPSVGSSPSGDEIGSSGDDQHHGPTGGDRPDRPQPRIPPQVPPPEPRQRPNKPGLAAGGGSCADGIPRSYELPPDPSWEGHREDATFQAVEQAIERHEKEHGVGSVPGQLKLAIAGKLRPQPNPWDMLRSAVATSVSTSVGAPQLTYKRFSRRQQPYLPRLKGRINTQPTAVVILDTSGSMCSGEDQAKAMTVIAQGLARLSSFRVFAGDTRVCSDKRVSAISQIEWAGGGGTDMAKLIQDVDRECRPDSIVLVTDGYTPWPKHKPRARVVVALTQRKSADFPVWARGIEVS